MSKHDISVRAVGGYYGEVGESLPDLKALTIEATGKPIRRVGRFIKLAVIGAARCVGQARLPADTAVYLTSRRGDLETNIEVMEELFRDGHAPKPLSFINTVSNAACYYVARHFSLHGRSCFVGGAHFAFETALELALLEMRAGIARSALVGCVEIATEPLAIHRRRLGLSPDTLVAEASHWLWLRQATDSARCVVAATEFFQSVEDLCAWFVRSGVDPGTAAFAAGQFLDAEDADAIRRALSLVQVFDYRAGRGYYDGQSGALVGAFLSDETAQATTVLHVNADPSGRLAVMLVRR